MVDISGCDDVFSGFGHQLETLLVPVSVTGDIEAARRSAERTKEIEGAIEKFLSSIEARLKENPVPSADRVVKYLVDASEAGAPAADEYLLRLRRFPRFAVALAQLLAEMFSTAFDKFLISSSPLLTTHRFAFGQKWPRNVGTAHECASGSPVEVQQLLGELMSRLSGAIAESMDNLECKLAAICRTSPELFYDSSSRVRELLSAGAAHATKYLELSNLIDQHPRQ